MESKLSKYIISFRKARGKMLEKMEKWKSDLDKGEYVCCVFMDLSKAFDTINHDLSSVIWGLLAHMGSGFFKFLTT